MTLTIELTEEQEARLAAQARAHGMNVEEYARLLLDRGMNDDSLEAWEEDMRALSEYSERIPVLKPEAFTRESIYGARG